MSTATLEKTNVRQSVEKLDPLDIFLQIESMRHLEDGWLDGTGKAPSESGLNWVAGVFDHYFSGKTRPYLYPTDVGGVQAEWSLNGWEVSLEIDLDNQSGYWHSLLMNHNICEEKRLDLNTQEAWKWLVGEILSKGASQR